MCVKYALGHEYAFLSKFIRFLLFLEKSIHAGISCIYISSGLLLASILSSPHFTLTTALWGKPEWGTVKGQRSPSVSGSRWGFDPGPPSLFNTLHWFTEDQTSDCSNRSAMEHEGMAFRRKSRSQKAIFLQHPKWTASWSIKKIVLFQMSFSA